MTETAVSTAAVRSWVDGDAVTDRDATRTRSDVDHLAADFVSECDGGTKTVAPLANVHVGSAKTAGVNADEDFVPGGGGFRNVAEGEFAGCFGCFSEGFHRVNAFSLGRYRW